MDVIPIDKETKRLNLEEDDKLIAYLRESIPDEPTSPEAYQGVPKEKRKPLLIKGKLVYPRDRQVAMRALARAEYKCEIDPDHTTFIRKSSKKPYTEPHHLIPMAYQDMFDVSIDQEENIVSLCSNCHNQIHYGMDADKLIRLLIDQRSESLKTISIDISQAAILKMYE